MSEAGIPGPASSNETKVAEQFVRARFDARVLTEYPGDVPRDFAAAYRCQDVAIARWPDSIAGWKATMFLGEEAKAKWCEERLLGPAFASDVRSVSPGQVAECPVIAGGLSGVEPEIVIRMGRDAPPDKLDWTVEEARDVIGELGIGAEILSSPLPTLADYGLPALISDFGGNFGIVVGKAIPEWRRLDEIAAQVFVDEELEARGVTSLCDGSGPIASLAFVLAKCARRGYPLRAGATITTGTITRFHPLQPGQSARLVFEGIGEVLCRAVRAAPRSPHRAD